MNNSPFLLSSSRFHFTNTAEDNEDGNLNVTDGLLGIERSFRCLDRTLFEDVSFQYKSFYLFDASNLLIVTGNGSQNGKRSTYIYFLELDSTNRTFKVLHRYDTELDFGLFQTMVFDELDSGRFALIGERMIDKKRTRVMLVGRINKDNCEITWEGSDPWLFYHKYEFPKLVGGKLCGLYRKRFDRGIVGVLKYWEMDLENENIEANFEFSEGGLYSKVPRARPAQYQWIGDICYIEGNYSHPFHPTPNWSQVYACDVGTFTISLITVPDFNILKTSMFEPFWTTVDDKKLRVIDSGYKLPARFDKLDSLSNLHGPGRYHNLGMRNPDKLLISMWFRIFNRRNTENGRNIYARAVNVLPNSEFRPFYFGPNVTQIDEEDLSVVPTTWTETQNQARLDALRL